MFPSNKLAWALALASPGAFANQQITPAAFSTVLIEQIVEAEGDTSASLSDEYAANLLLQDPDSVYSNLKTVTSKDLSPAWESALRLARVTPQRSFELYAHHMGLTKARPGIDVQVAPAFERDLAGRPLSPVTGANLTKAAVDADIYRGAILSLGFNHSALAANYAVGAQILRDALSGVNDPEERDDLDLRSDVLDRFVGMTETSELSDADAEYLQGLLYAQVRAASGGTSRTFGGPYVPAQFRVARLAVAYHEQTGRFAGQPCDANGLHIPRSAGTGKDGDTRDLCSSDATDQAVYAWYLNQYRDQAEGKQRYPDKVVYVSRLELLLRPLAIISEVAGIGSFINYTTGLGSVFRGTMSAQATKSMRSRILQNRCRL